MKIVHRPRRLFFLGITSLVCIPLFAVNLWVYKKVPLQTFWTRENIILLSLAGVWTLLTSLWVLQAKWKGFWSFLALGTIVLWGNLFFLVTSKNYSLAFYALFLLILFFNYLSKLYKTLREPYYNSKKRWYQGIPHFIPILEANLSSPQNSGFLVHLSSLGTTGFYGYLEKNSYPSPALIEQISEVELKLGGLKLNSAVELISIDYDKQKQGFVSGGFRFAKTSPDEQKRIHDFIDRVQTMGLLR
ncbi:MAG: hypothetical protein AB7F43_03220 [Bacteriovoracia bacterium]